MAKLDILHGLPFLKIKSNLYGHKLLFILFIFPWSINLRISSAKAQSVHNLINSTNQNKQFNLHSPQNQKQQPTNIVEQKNNLGGIPESITVKQFEIVGSSVFSQEELQEVIQPFVGRTLSFAELFQVRSAITKLYTDNGYINSGAYIPEQEINSGKLTIQVLEGGLEDINVTGTKRLNPNYIRKRLELAAGKPVKVDSLLEALQMLRLDPLIENISAELSAGIRPGTSLLDIEIEEADAFNFSTTFDNARSPSVGTDRRSIGFTHKNLLGFGDKFNFQYTNTDGSDGFDFAYVLPVNARNTQLGLRYSTNSNDVIEPPFTPLDIESESRYYELSLRQPIIQKPNTELSLGLAFSRIESETSLLDRPFGLSRGADEQGRTRISAIRFSQEWVNRNEKQVLAARSQFSIGVDVFDATINEDAPDSSFFAWRGQGQWVRRLDEDFLFLLRGDIQLATSSLVPLEQFRVGGFNSVRGYRQDLVLGDSGMFASAELRIPIVRIPAVDGLVQLTPFFDIGTVWNNDDLEIENDILPSVGIGLNFSAGDRFSARIDWGIPLVEVDLDSKSLQEDGIYFSINYNLL